MLRAVSQTYLMLGIIHATYFLKVLETQSKLTESEFPGNEVLTLFLSLEKLKKKKIDMIEDRCMQKM